jgi:hypothetical protein
MLERIYWAVEEQSFKKFKNRGTNNYGQKSFSNPTSM